jgi:hypothetical protein
MWPSINIGYENNFALRKACENRTTDTVRWLISLRIDTTKLSTSDCHEIYRLLIESNV